MFANGGRYTAKAEDVIRQSMHVPTELIVSRPIITIRVSTPKSRKRPITGDMTQMCQDLGIEPFLNFSDSMNLLNKAITRIMTHSFDEYRKEMYRGF